VLDGDAEEVEDLIVEDVEEDDVVEDVVFVEEVVVGPEDAEEPVEPEQEKTGGPGIV